MQTGGISARYRKRPGTGFSKVHFEAFFPNYFQLCPEADNCESLRRRDEAGRGINPSLGKLETPELSLLGSPVLTAGSPTALAAVEYLPCQMFS